MPNSALIVEAIKSEIEVALGGLDLDVELKSEDYEKCIADAIRVYNRNRPRHGNATLAVTTSQKKYGPLTPHPNIQGILSVDFVNGQRPTGVDPFDTLGRNLSQGFGAGNGETFGSLDQQLQYLEQARNISSSETEWKVSWEATGLYLYIDIVQQGLLCSYSYSWHVEPTDDPVKGMRHIDDSDVDWVLDYIKAKAREIVAHKRRKFGGISNPDGGQDPTDAAELMQEAREDLERLKEEILNRRRPLPPVIG